MSTNDSISKNDANPKLLTKQITCNELCIASVAHKDCPTNGNLNRANSICAEHALLLKKNASEASLLVNLNSGLLHRSHELENLNLTDEQLQNLVDNELNSPIMSDPKLRVHLKRTTELENLSENLNEIENKE